MDLHDYLNVRRVLRLMAKEWGCPVFVLTSIVRSMINRSWKNAMSDPEEKAKWEEYFPDGKPTVKQFILRMGYAHERNEEMPFFFKD